MTSLLGSARGMAIGTVASRASGFLRTAAVTAVIGVRGVGTAYDVANTTPNIIYDLLLGGILSSVLVPLLVRAFRQGDDGGQEYFQKLFSLVVFSLTAATAVLVVAAPLVIDLYASGLDPATRATAVLFTRLCLPQVLFYGASAVLTAALNTRDRYVAPMWAPVLNNIVVVATCGLLLALPGGGPSSTRVTTAQVLVLGLGTTAGIVAQAAALLPSLRAAGVRLRLRLDLRGSGLSEVGPLARWTVLYVVASQAAYLVLVRLGTDDALVRAGRGYGSYNKAYLLWQLPHAVIAVSLITALLPAMSRAAADGRNGELRASLDHGLRLTVAALVPASVALVVLGPAVATAVFGYRSVTVDEARFIGLLLGVLALGLVPYSAYQLQLRAFYALGDTRTPFLVNLVVNVTAVGVGVGTYQALPARDAVLGLAVGQAASFVAGLAVVRRVLVRRLGVHGGGRVLQTAVRCLLAALAAAVPAEVSVRVLGAVAGDGPAAALVVVAAGGALLLVGYLAAARRLHVREVRQLLGPLAARLPR